MYQFNRQYSLNTFTSVRWQNSLRANVRRTALLNPKVKPIKNVVISPLMYFPNKSESTTRCCDPVLRYRIRRSYPCSLRLISFPLSFSVRTINTPFSCLYERSSFHYRTIRPSRGLCDSTAVIYLGFASSLFIVHEYWRDFTSYIASCHPLYLLYTHSETGSSGSCIRLYHCV